MRATCPYCLRVFSLEDPPPDAIAANAVPSDQIGEDVLASESDRIEAQDEGTEVDADEFDQDDDRGHFLNEVEPDQDFEDGL